MHGFAHVNGRKEKVSAENRLLREGKAALHERNGFSVLGEDLVMPTIKKTLRMFEFVRGVIQSTGEAPKISELQKQFNMRSPASVHQHLRKMEALGWITIIPNVTRGIRLVEQEQNKAA